MKLKQVTKKLRNLRLQLAIYLITLSLQLQEIKEIDEKQLRHIEKVLYGGAIMEEEIDKIEQQEEQGMSYEDVFDNSALEFPSIF